MDDEVQAAVQERRAAATTDTLAGLADTDWFRAQNGPALRVARPRDGLRRPGPDHGPLALRDLRRSGGPVRGGDPPGARAGPRGAPGRAGSAARRVVRGDRAR
ncbi:hypothetical protein MCM47_27540 [Kitasatospora sp. A2-31]|nr:hypothetical protein [Kitasatospora sp. A2-31]MCG6498005.1 hypothetical protein [Kitasatospora sp. A2-31]